MNRLMTFVAVATLATTLTACGKDGKNGTAGANGVAGAKGIPALVTVADVLKTNANIAFASYSDSLITATQLQTAVDAFVAAPDASNFQAVKSAWLAAREPYGQTEIYRFREGPIDALKDDGSMGVDGDGAEGRINAWPLAEAIIDYVVTDVDVDGEATPEDTSTTAAIAGNIINDSASFPSITQDVLVSNFELGGGESNVTTGYHAIEFLLWGQDLNQDGSGVGSERDSSPGQRPMSDYALDASCTSGTDNTVDPTICARRADYLQVASALLVEDLTRIVAAWNPSTAGNHYQAFVAGGDASFAAIFEAMGRLGYGELAGERISSALLDDKQENEHSCFSDNTHRDIFLNAKGIQNTFAGEYQRIDGSIISGSGIDDYLISVGQVAKENELRAAYEATMISIAVLDQEAKTGNPFDNQIVAGVANTAKTEQVQATIDMLIAQTLVLDTVITALDINTGDLRQDTEAF